LRLLERHQPSRVIDLDSEAFCGDRWSGQAIQVGPQVVLEVVQPTMRLRGAVECPARFNAFNQLNTAFPNHLGVYARVRTPGPIPVADPVMLLS
jgi:MOSC domain-containing protein YiiM